MSAWYIERVHIHFAVDSLHGELTAVADIEQTVQRRRGGAGGHRDLAIGRLTAAQFRAARHQRAIIRIHAAHIGAKEGDIRIFDAIDIQRGGADMQGIHSHGIQFFGIDLPARLIRVLDEDRGRLVDAVIPAGHAEIA